MSRACCSSDKLVKNDKMFHSNVFKHCITMFICLTDVDYGINLSKILVLGTKIKKYVYFFYILFTQSMHIAYSYIYKTTHRKNKMISLIQVYNIRKR